STVFFNAVCMILYMVAAWRLREWSVMKVLLAGFIAGLLLSTRSVMIIPLIFTYVYLLKFEMGWHRVWQLGAATFAGFVILFIPLYLWDPSLFMAYNPITLQKSFLPDGLLFFIIVLTVIWSFRIHDKGKLMYACGVMLFITVAAHCVYFWQRNDWQDVLYSSEVDISYFVLALPFLFLSLFPRIGERNEKTEKRN
nr:hypothetical protein [Bacteroidota bacterium]